MQITSQAGAFGERGADEVPACVIQLGVQRRGMGDHGDLRGQRRQEGAAVVGQPSRRGDHLEHSQPFAAVAERDRDRARELPVALGGLPGDEHTVDAAQGDAPCGESLGDRREHLRDGTVVPCAGDPLTDPANRPERIGGGPVQQPVDEPPQPHMRGHQTHRDDRRSHERGQRAPPAERRKAPW